jgi:hypothetical protein
VGAGGLGLESGRNLTVEILPNPFTRVSCFSACQREFEQLSHFGAKQYASTSYESSVITLLFEGPKIELYFGEVKSQLSTGGATSSRFLVNCSRLRAGC